MYENNVVDISRWKIKQIFMFYMQMRRINQQEHSSLTFLNTYLDLIIKFSIITHNH